MKYGGTNTFSGMHNIRGHSSVPQQSGGCQICRKKRYEGVQFNAALRGGGCKFSRKKRYVTLEWPLTYVLY